MALIPYNTCMKPVYTRMLKAMARQDSAREPKEWSVYIARCADQTLYTGIAKDVFKRLARHNAGKGAAYTRTRRPVRVVYHAAGLTRSEALIEEARIKSLPRAQKAKLAQKKISQ